MCEATVKLKCLQVCGGEYFRHPQPRTSCCIVCTLKLQQIFHVFFFSGVLCIVFVCYFSVKAVKTASVVQLYLLVYQFQFIHNVLGKNMRVVNAK